MGATFQQFLARVATRQRVVLLGGLAAVAHGLLRPTKVGDAWLDPLESAEAWAAALALTLREFPGLSLYSLGARREFPAEEIAEIIARDEVLRVRGLQADLDLFRKPTGLECGDFGEVWERATIWADTVRVIDPIDLILTKETTGRNQDRQDVMFLENKVRGEFGARAAVATPEEARALFARYADHAVCARALENPHPEVRALARELLAELAAQGDWFSRDILARTVES